MVNVFLGGFNLLPGAPLDGGRLLCALLWRHYRDRARAADISAQVGRALGFAFVALGMLEVLAGALAGLWLALIGWFVMAAAAGERYQAFIEQTGDLRVCDVMTRCPHSLPNGGRSLTSSADSLLSNCASRPFRWWASTASPRAC